MATPRDTPRDYSVSNVASDEPTRSSSLGGVLKTLRNRMQSVSTNVQRAINLCPSLDGSNETREDFEMSYEAVYELRQALRASIREALAACNSCALLDPVLTSMTSSVASGASAIPHNLLGVNQLAFAAPPVFVGGGDTATRERTQIGLWHRCSDDMSRVYWYHDVSRRTCWTLPAHADSVDALDDDDSDTSHQSPGTIIYRPVIDARGSLFFVDHSTQAATNSVPCSQHCWIETHENRRILYRNAKTLEVLDVRPKTAPSARQPPPAPPVSGAPIMPPPPSRKNVYAKSTRYTAHTPVVLAHDEYEVAPPPIDDSEL